MIAKQPKLKAVLFDMDGTVIDTEAVYTLAWQAAFEKLGMEFPTELFSRCIGLSLVMSRACVNEHYNDPEFFDKVFPIAASWVYNYQKLNGVPVKAGFAELIDYLDENGIKAVIATSTSHAAAVQNLKDAKIFHRFVGLIGGDDVENGKPGPEPFLRAAQLANADVSECLAVEDSANGVRSAVAAGVRCIHVCDVVDIGNELKSTLFRSVTTLDEIIGIIEELNGSNQSHCL